MNRSEIMSRIRSKETGPEVALRKALWAAGLRGYRKNWGRPSIDVAFVGRKVAVFVDSCFWHLCPRHGKVPKAKRAWWRGKLEANRIRDRQIAKRLREEGWLVVRLWTHMPIESMVKCVQLALARPERGGH